MSSLLIAKLRQQTDRSIAVALDVRERILKSSLLIQKASDEPDINEKLRLFQKYCDEVMQHCKVLATSLDERKAVIAEYSLNLRDCYQRTNNPFYVYLATSIFHNVYKTTPPIWCLDYFGKCSAAIVLLVDDETTPPRDCADKVKDIFGFTRTGWNAFNEMRELSLSARMHETYQSLRAQNLASIHAAIQTLEKYGLADDRSRRRRISALKKTLGNLISE